MFTVSLRPHALLSRFRPLRLDTLQCRIRYFQRTGLALGLFRTHFPDQALPPNLPQLDWWQILAIFLDQAEQANWFETDSYLLDQAWATWMEDPTEGGDSMAAFLHYITGRLHGFGPGNTIFDYPPLELMRALFLPEVEAVTAGVMDQAGLDDFIDHWTEADRNRAWQWLNQIETDPGLYHEPTRWLPELVRWACGRTGNFLLDMYSHRQSGWLRWDDAEEVRVAYRRAQPVMAHLQRLMTWYEQDPARLALLTQCLTKGVNYDHLDW